MDKLFQQFLRFKENHNISIEKSHFDRLIYKFNFYIFINDIQPPKNIFEEKCQCKVIIIDKIEYLKEQYFIICFDQTLIIIIESKLFQIKSFFSKNQDSDIFILKNDIRNIFVQSFGNLESNIIFKNSSQKFNEEINIFLEQCNILNNIFFVKLIEKSLIGLLIQKSYKNSFNDRRNNFQHFFVKTTEHINIKQDNCIILKQFCGNSIVRMIYHLELQKFFVIKVFFDDEEKEKLSQREYNNYLNLHHPFLLKCYGITNLGSEKMIILEYIDGITLENIHNLKLKMTEKIDIILKISLVLSYLHQNNYIYRDLKPSNLMLDKNKTVILIDLNRLVKKDQVYYENQTVLASQFISPEIAELIEFSYSADIYSLGLIMYYIIFEESPSVLLIEMQYKRKAQLSKLIYKCTNKDPIQRPSADEIFIHLFPIYIGLLYYYDHSSKQEIDNEINYYLKIFPNINDSDLLKNLGLLYQQGMYVERNMKKAIDFFKKAADLNNKDAQFFLGTIYFEGIYVMQNIKSAIYFFELAANQNYIEAQFNLGVLYSNECYHALDIRKAVYYYSLAANQNFPRANYHLGLLYFEGKYFKRNISKTIYYFSQAAEKNESQAQYALGFIFFDGKYTKRDIKKAYFYFNLASNQNFPPALYFLGLIYYQGMIGQEKKDKAICCFTRASDYNISQAQLFLGHIYYNEKEYFDINKAIHYFKLAANNNLSEAQYKLGVIYYTGQYVVADISIAIHFLSLASNQNHINAQIYLGLIYSDKRFGQFNIQNSIYYFSLAADQNSSLAQFILGKFYYEGKYIQKNMDKAIKYFLHAASQNDPNAEAILGLIYSIKGDLCKSVHFFSLAALQNHPLAQYNIGICYISGIGLKKDIKIGQYYIYLASTNGYKLANFAYGYLFHDEEYNKCDIEKVIHNYKEASSFNIQYAKNNLGVIYKNGYGDTIKEQPGLAIEYFSEAIRQENDYLSMYNLAHIYLYDENTDNIDKSIDLLIKISKEPEGLINTLFKSWYQSQCIIILLGLALIKKCGFNITKIKQTINQRMNAIYPNESSYLSKKICQIIVSESLFDKLKFESIYDSFSEIDFLYNIFLKPIISFNVKYTNKENSIRYPNAKNITSQFYDGFGLII